GAGHLGLPAEALPRPAPRVDALPVDELEGHAAAGGRLRDLRLEHRPHPALPQQPHDPVPAIDDVPWPVPPLTVRRALEEPPDHLPAGAAPRQVAMEGLGLALRDPPLDEPDERRVRRAGLDGWALVGHEESVAEPPGIRGEGGKST